MVLGGGGRPTPREHPHPQQSQKNDTHRKKAMTSVEGRHVCEVEAEA